MKPAAQFEKRYYRERAAREEAERLLEEKSDELYESLLQVQSSEGLLKSALASMADGLLLTSKEHAVILASEQMNVIYPELAEIFVKDAKLAGSFDLLLSHPSYRAMLEHGQDEAFFELLLSGGRTVSVSARFTPEGFIASTHRDVTRQKQAEEERRGLLVDLLRAQRMEAIGRMSGMIAHDFNNIIASIKGYSGFLQEDLPDDPGLRDSVKRIQNAAAKAEALIQQILEYGNREQAKHVRVSLIPVLEDCVELLSATLPDDVGISFDPPEQPVWVDVDETRLERLFMNLLTNARQALTGRAGRLSVYVDRFDALDLEKSTIAYPDVPVGETCTTITGYRLFNEPCVRITLVDTGTGIETDVIERIFEMYFSTRGSSAHRGVGMSSVADIASRYGGGVKLTSLSGAGTAVEVVFPVVNRLTTVQAAVLAERRDVTRHDVMLIDDDENVGEMIRQMLGRAGISAEYQQFPEIALDILLKDPNRCKLVVSDQVMPQLKGSEIYTRLRDAGVALPFVICSAQVDPESTDIMESLRDDFLKKPVDRDELLAKVQKYL